MRSLKFHHNIEVRDGRGLTGAGSGRSVPRERLINVLVALFSSLLSSLFRVKSCQSEVVHSTLSLSLPGAGCLASVTRWCVTVDCPGGERRVNKWCVVPGACVEVSSVGTVLGMMGQVDQTCPLTISCQPARPTATTSLQLPTQSNIPTHSRTVQGVPSD